MSKSTSKQKYDQLTSWLDSRKSGTTSSKQPRKFSKTDHYKKQNNRYGSKKSY